MVKIVKCRLKLEITATEWVNQGDHPMVQRLPDDVHLPPGNNKDVWGCMRQPNGSTTYFPPHTMIIDTGGNTFAVDNQYYSDYYEEIIEPVKEDHEIHEELEKQ